MHGRKKEQTIGATRGTPMGRTILQEREGERAERGSTYLALVCKRARSDPASRTCAHAMKVLIRTEGRLSEELAPHGKNNFNIQ